MKKLFQFFRKHLLGLRGKMIFSISVIMVTTISILIAIIAVFYTNKYEANDANTSNMSISNMINSITNYYDELLMLTNQVVYNNDLLEYIRTGTYINESDFGEKGLMQAIRIGNDVFGNSFDSRTNAVVIMLLKQSNVLLFKSPYALKNIGDDYTEQAWYTKAIEAQGEAVFTGLLNSPGFVEYNQPAFAISRMITTTKSDDYGVLLIEANLLTIRNICDSIHLSNNGFVNIADASGNLIYTPANGTPADVIDKNSSVFNNLMLEFSKQPSGKFKTVANGEEYQIVFNHIPVSGWTIYTVTPTSIITKDIKNITWTVVFAGIISVLVMIVVTYNFISYFIGPLFLLKKSMDSADTGNLDARVDVTTKDEIGLVSLSYNRMLIRIKNLMEEIIDEQKEIRKLELKSLQSQINPHFLYNTLSTIIWMAETKSDQIVPTTEALSKFFRISLSKGKDVITVEQELEHVQNYLLIESKRFTNKFTFEISASPNVKNYLTLKIILQPIVENAIYHGIVGKVDAGYIKVSATEADDNVVFIVSDNGVGMDKEKSTAILNNTYVESSGKGSGVAIKNVNERIKLFFGKEYGISIESEPMNGTKVYITIPKKIVE